MSEDIRDIVTSPLAITIGAMLVAMIFVRLIVRLIRPLLIRWVGRTKISWDDHAVDAMTSPVSLLFAIQVFRVAVPWLPLEARGVAVASNVIAILTTLTVLWVIFRAIDLIRGILERRSWAIERPASMSFLAIVARFAKVTVVILGIIVGLAQLGVSVASLIAGLGIGGLAIALAAQKTIENLFGTLSIGVDRPLHEGDFVKVYDYLGHVEQIGLRSTRVRTLDRTIVTIPNGDLANAKIESYTARDRMRLSCTIGLVYETTAAQMRGVLEDLEAILRAHPKIWTEDLLVRFKDLGQSSLDIEVMAWFETSKWMEYMEIRQEMLLQFMEAIERRKTSIAFPTRTVHVVAAPPPP